MNERTKSRNHREPNIFKGLAAGLIGGLVASWTMNRFQDVWIKIADDQKQRRQQSSSDEEQDDTTVRAASAISEGLFDIS